MTYTILTLLFFPAKSLGCNIHVEATDNATLLNVEGLEHFDVDVVTWKLLYHFVRIGAAEVDESIVGRHEIVPRAARVLNRVLIIRLHVHSKVRRARRLPIYRLNDYIVEVLRGELAAVQGVPTRIILYFARNQALVSDRQPAPMFALPLLGWT